MDISVTHMDNINTIDKESTQLIAEVTIVSNIPNTKLIDEKCESRKELLEKVTTRGLSGLSNLTNTCYLNSALQALSATNTLLAYLIHPSSEILNHLQHRVLDIKYTEFEKNKNTNDTNDNLSVNTDEIEREAKLSMTYRLRILYKYMWSENCEVKPENLKYGVERHMTFFRGYRQHDAQEFLSALLDRIHEDTMSKANISYTLDNESSEVEKYLKTLTITLDRIKNDKTLDKKTLVVKTQEILNKIREIQIKNIDQYLMIQSLWTWNNILSKSYSIINDIFSGLSLTIIKCKECHNEKYCFERFDIITLHLPENYDIEKQKYTLDELFKNYTNTEQLTGKNQYYCCYCLEKRDAEKRHMIYQNPNKLVLLIKKYQKFNNTMIKSNILIEYNHEINIFPYMSNHIKNINTKYKLYATIRHSGGYNGGHYYAYTKNGINGYWFLYDDGDVYNVDADEPLKSNSYILFYELNN